MNTQDLLQKARPSSSPSLESESLLTLRDTPKHQLILGTLAAQDPQKEKIVWLQASKSELVLGVLSRHRYSCRVLLVT